MSDPSTPLDSEFDSSGASSARTSFGRDGSFSLPDPGVPAPDPSRVAGHYAGVGDGDLLDLAARDEGVRRLLVDVAVVVAEVDAEVDVGSELGGANATPAESGAGTRRPLSAEMRARAIAAFGSAGSGRRAAVPRVARTAEHDVERAQAPMFVAPRRRIRWGRAAIAAAVLLVPGVGLAVSSRRVEAASLALEGLDRVGAGGDVETGGPRRLAIGQRVEARAGERVALRLVGGTRVVLADRAQLSVGCDGPCDGRCGGAVFQIEAGGVVVAAAAGRAASPVAVRVPSTGRIDVWSGAARVDRDGDGLVSLSLRSDARVRWAPERGAARELAGPAVFSLRSTDGAIGDRDGRGRAAGAAVDGTAGGADGVGPVVDSPVGSVVGSASAALDAAAFRDLEFFGGPLRRMGDEIRVGCRRWRIVDSDPPPASGAKPARDSAGPDDTSTEHGGRGAGGQVESSQVASRVARARRSEMGGAPAIRFDFGADDVGRVAWPADAPVYGARRLEVRFRAAPAAGSVGARRTIRVRLEGVPGAAGTVALDVESVPVAGAGPVAGGDSPRLLRALLPLPASFRDAPGGLSDLVLAWSVEGGPSTVWFESVVFLEVGAADVPFGGGGSAGGGSASGGTR